MLCPFLVPSKGGSFGELTFAGHSLGGSLAALLCCLVRTRLHAPAAQLQCFTFGSPPVLSLASGSSASDVLQVRCLACNVDRANKYCLAFQAARARVWFREKLVLRLG